MSLLPLVQKAQSLTIDSAWLGTLPRSAWCWQIKLFKVTEVTAVLNCSKIVFRAQTPFAQTVDGRCIDYW